MAAESSQLPVVGEEQSLADLYEYGQTLGVDLEREAYLQWVVEEAFNAPLPASWTEHTDEEERVYFFNEATNMSSWEHPMDAVYRELVGFVKQVSESAHPLAEDQRLALIQEHLRQVHQRALERLEGWSGPYASEAGEYYYNEALKVSTWESPLGEWEQELSTRHALLCRCLVPEYTALAGAEDEHFHDAEDILKNLQLPLDLIRRDTSGDQPPATPTSARSFHTARSACSARSQPVSGRSKTSGGTRHVPGGRSPRRMTPRGEDDGEHEFTFGSTNKVLLPSFASST